MGKVGSGRESSASFMNTLVLGMAALMLCVLVLSFVFVAVEADHDCAGGDCPICMLIQQCEQTIRSIGGGFSLAGFSILLISFCVASVLMRCISILCYTPVSFKTRLNN